jgi:toxin CptA
LPKKNDPPLLVELKSSQRLKQLVAVIHILALSGSIANALPFAIKSALFIGITIHLIYLLKHLNDKQYQIKQTPEFGWEISKGNDFSAIQILNSTVITTFAIFLHYSNNKHKQSLLILNDALPDDDYRRLIVRLKTACKE